MTNIRQQWRTSAVFSTSGPTMIPGRVAQEQQRQVEGVAQLHEAGRLVGAVAVDGPAEVRRVVGDDADAAGPRCGRARSPCRAPKSRRSSSTEPVSASVVDDRADVVDAQPVLGDQRCAAAAGRRSPTSASGALEVRQVALGDRRPPRPRRPRRRRRRRWAPAPTSGRPPRAGTRRGRRPRSSPGRPCRCSTFAVAMITSQQPSSAALPAKQRPELMPTSGTSPLTARRRSGRPCSRGRHPVPSVSPGRPPPPSVKNTTGSRHSRGQLEHAVLLAVVLRALRAGEHGVVVGHHHALGALVVEAGRR